MTEYKLYCTTYQSSNTEQGVSEVLLSVIIGVPGENTHVQPGDHIISHILMPGDRIQATLVRGQSIHH